MTIGTLFFSSRGIGLVYLWKMSKQCLVKGQQLMLIVLSAEIVQQEKSVRNVFLETSEGQKITEIHVDRK